jgi:hypothetical protein
MDLHFIAEQVAGVTVVFAIAAGAAWGLRNYSAASRHMVWWLATLASLLVPVASFVTGTPCVIVTPLQVVPLWSPRKIARFAR